MALTPAERKRKSRERKKARLAAAPEATTPILARPFSKFVQEEGNWNEVTTYLEWAGIKEPPQFESDEDPEWEEVDGPNRGSIGRAERMVGCFLDAASELARIVNFYKREEIERAISRLENSDLRDPAVKKRAFADIVRLTRLRDRLKRQVRWTLPQWKVKEED